MDHLRNLLRIGVRGAVAIVLTMGALACDRPPVAESNAAWRTKNYAAAKPLLAAIEAYRSKHATYPPSLDALVPEYISKLPETYRADRSWYYTVRTEPIEFSLSFEGSRSGWGDVYRSEDNAWDEQGPS